MLCVGIGGWQRQEGPHGTPSDPPAGSGRTRTPGGQCAHRRCSCPPRRGAPPPAELNPPAPPSASTRRTAPTEPWFDWCPTVWRIQQDRRVGWAEGWISAAHALSEIDLPTHPRDDPLMRSRGWTAPTHLVHPELHPDLLEQSFQLLAGGKRRRQRRRASGKGRGGGIGIDGAGSLRQGPNTQQPTQGRRARSRRGKGSRGERPDSRASRGLVSGA